MRGPVLLLLRFVGTWMGVTGSGTVETGIDACPVRYGTVRLLAAAVADAGIGVVAVFVGDRCVCGVRYGTVACCCCCWGFVFVVVVVNGTKRVLFELSCRTERIACDQLNSIGMTSRSMELLACECWL